MITQNNRAQREENVASLRKEMARAADDVQRALREVETNARLRLSTLDSECKFHAASRYFLEKVAELHAIEGEGAPPSLPSGDPSVAPGGLLRDAGLALLNQEPDAPSDLGQRLLAQSVLSSGDARPRRAL